MPRDGRDEHGGIYDRDFDDPDLIGSADPAAPPEIRANYLQHDHDREISIKLVRFVRELLSQPALVALVEEETAPRAQVTSGEDIVAAFAREGGPCQHASSTCRMVPVPTPASIPRRCASTARRACASWTGPSCPSWFRATPMGRSWRWRR